jgi:hypothetical protein
MRLELTRIYKGRDYTIGKLYVDGVYLCDTLEDTDRGLSSAMTSAEIKALKVFGKTAIPRGMYFVDMQTVSPRFRLRKWAKAHGGRVPRLQGVRGFDGVLIHPGNTAADTDGCILVGYNKAKGKVLESVAAYERLFALLDAAPELITLTIR